MSPVTFVTLYITMSSGVYQSVKIGMSRGRITASKRDLVHTTSVFKMISILKTFRRRRLNEKFKNYWKEIQYKRACCIVKKKSIRNFSSIACNRTGAERRKMIFS